VVVAEVDGRIAGFAELEATGHIDRFFVSADHQGLGIGRALLDAIEAEARRIGLPRLDADVSLTALPFFERRGFQTVAAQVVTLRGVAFRNVRLIRVLDAAAEGSSAPEPPGPAPGARAGPGER
jgi:putative acetyltransferase